MRIKTYDKIKDSNDDLIEGLKVLTIPFHSIQKDGTYETFTASTASFTEVPSVVLIIDDNTLLQLEKTKLEFEEGQYQLYLKDGEEFTYPVESEKEKKIRELKEQLAALESTQIQGE